MGGGAECRLVVREASVSSLQAAAMAMAIAPAAEDIALPAMPAGPGRAWRLQEESALQHCYMITDHKAGRYLGGGGIPRARRSAPTGSRSMPSRDHPVRSWPKPVQCVVLLPAWPSCRPSAGSS